MPPREEQQEIPGTERKKIPAVEKAARKYADARDERMKLSEKECLAKANLIAVCQDNIDEFDKDAEGVARYQMGDEIVEFTAGKPKVKVKSGSTEGEEGQD